MKKALLKLIFICIFPCIAISQQNQELPATVMDEKGQVCQVQWEDSSKRVVVLREPVGNLVRKLRYISGKESLKPYFVSKDSVYLRDVFIPDIDSLFMLLGHEQFGSGPVSRVEDIISLNSYKVYRSLFIQKSIVLNLPDFSDKKYFFERPLEFHHCSFSNLLGGRKLNFGENSQFIITHSFMDIRNGLTMNADCDITFRNILFPAYIQIFVTCTKKFTLDSIKQCIQSTNATSSSVLFQKPNIKHLSISNLFFDTLNTQSQFVINAGSIQRLDLCDIGGATLPYLLKDIDGIYIMASSIDSLICEGGLCAKKYGFLATLFKKLVDLSYSIPPTDFSHSYFDIDCIFRAGKFTEHIFSPYDVSRIWVGFEPLKERIVRQNNILLLELLKQRHLIPQMSVLSSVSQQKEWILQQKGLEYLISDTLLFYASRQKERELLDYKQFIRQKKYEPEVQEEVLARIEYQLHKLEFEVAYFSMLNKKLGKPIDFWWSAYCEYIGEYLLLSIVNYGYKGGSNFAKWLIGINIFFILIFQLITPFREQVSSYILFGTNMPEEKKPEEKATAISDHIVFGDTKPEDDTKPSIVASADSLARNNKKTSWFV
ncbi:MAG: hypothetical protein MUF71_21400, partial [Candidatus Kapabacteria bacterium]|nr:hypothetical protein [Candidatus Kapabacteria bacterium]